MDLDKNKQITHSRTNKQTNLVGNAAAGAVVAWGGGGGIDSPPSASQQFLGFMVKIRIVVIFFDWSIHLHSQFFVNFFVWSIFLVFLGQKYYCSLC